MITNSQLIEAQAELGRILNGEMRATLEAREFTINTFCERVKKSRIRLNQTPLEISREEVIEALQNDHKLVYLRSSSPLIIGQGEHQIVIGLRNGLVAKMNHRRETDNSFMVGLRSFSHLNATKRNLVSLGLQIPELFLLRYFWKGERIVLTSDVEHFLGGPGSQRENDQKLDRNKLPRICITPDLREEGRYNVIDYDERRIKGLINRDEIISQFRRITGVLTNLDENTGFRFLHDPHLTYSPRGIKVERNRAIRKMFLVQIPNKKTEPGKLVVGDLDHVYVYPKVEEAE